MTSTSANNIEWTVPKEWHLQKVRVELRGVFTFGSFTRIILVSVGLAIGIWYATEKALGPLEFNWVRAIGLSVLFGIGVLLVGATTSCVPPTICVSAKGITVIKTHRPFMVSFNDLAKISIQTSDTPILTFRKENHDYRYAIPQSLDLNQLRQDLERLSGRPVGFEKVGDPDGAANGSRSMRSETNSRPSAGGSRP